METIAAWWSVAAAGIVAGMAEGVARGRVADDGVYPEAVDSSTAFSGT